MVNAAKHKKLKEDVPGRINRLIESHFFTSQKQIDKVKNRKHKAANYIGMEQESLMLKNANNQTRKRLRFSLNEL